MNLRLALLLTAATVGGLTNGSLSVRKERAEEVVEAVNFRDLGAPGWRRVRIDIRNDGSVVRSFQVVNVWRRQGDGASSLYYLERPPGLAGTSYLEIERPGLDADLQVFLYLPTSRGRVLSIAAEDLGEGLLGSDFGYSDLRIVLPRSIWSYRIGGHAMMLGRPVTALEARPLRGARLPWRRAVFHVDLGLGLILGADYFYDSVKPFKQMRVDRLERIGGVWTATQMTMSAGSKRSTRITLLGARFHLKAVDPALFEPDDLPRAGERLAPLSAARDAAEERDP